MTVHLVGTGNAPLAATQRYSFTAHPAPEGESRLTISIVQRGSWDDYGIAEHPEQEAFVRDLLSSLGVPTRTGYPGEWLFVERAAFDTAFEALRAALREPLATAPVASAQRTVTAAEAPAVSSALMRRFLELVSKLAGLSGEDWVCFDKRIDSSGPETTRTEGWRRGEIYVKLDATAIESGHGIHGEQGTLSINSTLGGERDAQVAVHLDMRSGGNVSITVRGVLDAQALADALVAP